MLLARGESFHHICCDVRVRFALLADFRIRPDSDAGCAGELHLLKIETYHRDLCHNSVGVNCDARRIDRTIAMLLFVFSVVLC